MVLLWIILYSLSQNLYQYQVSVDFRALLSLFSSTGFGVVSEGNTTPKPVLENRPKWLRKSTTPGIGAGSQETLGLERFKVMREKGTERAFSGKYLYESGPGTYFCAGCRNPLFASQDKYDSGAGWPSFLKPIDSKSVYYLEDRNLPIKRYEVLCRTCDSHLGHVFKDGPPPKGLRYCINSVTLILENRYNQDQ